MKGMSWAAAATAAGLLAACGSGGGNDDAPACDPDTEFCGAIPSSAFACEDAQYWPLAVESGSRPLLVHYSRRADADVAAEMLAILETAWDVQIDAVGFAEPLPDGGLCGPDDRYDVFLWRGLDGAFVEALADNPATVHDDFTTYMAINPFAELGGEFLDTTLAHELNHAVQASDDWWESALIFEMTATYAETLVFPEQDDWFYTLEDFQNNPEWSLFYDDGYETWYMYGAAMFLHFLEQRHYAGDPGFIARVWRAARSDPAVGRPDYLDALRSVLASELGVTLEDAVVEFMQWRWFVAELDDGMHFARGADWPFTVWHEEVDARVSQAVVELEAMVYGAHYLRLVNPSGVQRQVAIDLAVDDADVDWRLTTAGGDAVAGTVLVPANGDLVIVATVLPLEPLSAGMLDFEPRTATLDVRAAN